MKRSIQLFVFTTVASAAFGGAFTVCSTGFAVASTSGCGAAITSPAANTLSADGNWYVASNSSGTFLSQAFVTINNSFPVGPTNPGSNPWLANDANSSWITPTNNQATTYPNAQYFYGTNFSLTSGQATSAQITGSWLADDYGTGIFLNGVGVGQSSLPAFGGLGGPLVFFSISNGGVGQAQFQINNNSLVFGLANDSTNHGLLAGGNTPTGLRVQISATAVPEPGTILLMGAGLAGVLVARRRRSA